MYNISINAGPPKGTNNKLLPANFYNRQRLNIARSQAEGTSIYEDVVYVRIGEPWDRLNIIDCEATDKHKHLYPVEFAEFQKNNLQTITGVPVDVLFPPESAMVANLRARGIFTIDQLVDLPNPSGPDVHLVKKAKRYLKAIAEAGSFHQYEKLIADKDYEIFGLKTQLAELQAELEAYKSNIERSKTKGFVDHQFDSHANPISPMFDPQTHQINAMGKITRGK